MESCQSVTSLASFRSIQSYQQQAGYGGVDKLVAGPVKATKDAVDFESLKRKLKLSIWGKDRQRVHFDSK